MILWGSLIAAKEEKNIIYLEILFKFTLPQALLAAQVFENYLIKIVPFSWNLSEKL